MKLHTPYRTALLIPAIALALGALLLVSAPVFAQAHTENLVAAAVTKAFTLPDGQIYSVPMWGFGPDHGSCAAVVESEITVPGPRITVLPSETSLTINLRNCLSEPVSIVVPGQATAGVPTPAPGGRLTALAPEATAGGGTQSYTFTSLRPGTFLYESGSHQAVQVQMGLYGALTKDIAPQTAYQGFAYAADGVVVFSEVDIDLHFAVASGNYGDGKAMTSTIDYAPTLFLVNGESYRESVAPVQTGAAPASPGVNLLRFVSAALESHAIVVDNASLSVVAEDGNLYPAARPQTSILLPAGKTLDVAWAPASGDYVVYDRALRLQAFDQSSGGMLAKLHVGPSAASQANPISARPDHYTATEGAPLVKSAASDGVLANDSPATGLIANLKQAPTSGTVTLNGDGTFTYTPTGYFHGIDTFAYTASDGTNVSDPTVVTIVVTATQNPPTANAGSFSVIQHQSRTFTLTATDPDGDPLTYYVRTLPAAGTLSVTSFPISAIAGLSLSSPSIVQVTTADPHGLPTGQSVNISGTATNALNGAWTATVTGPTTFTVPAPVTTFYAGTVRRASVDVTNVRRFNGLSALVTTATPHGLSNGQSITIDGNTYKAANGTWTVSNVASLTFRIALSIPNNTTPGTGGAVEFPEVPISAITSGVGISTLTTPSTQLLRLPTGTSQVVISNTGTTPPINGTWSATRVGTATSVSFTIPRAASVTGWAGSVDAVVRRTLTNSDLFASATKLAIPKGLLVYSPDASAAPSSGANFSFCADDGTDHCVAASASNTVDLTVLAEPAKPTPNLTVSVKTNGGAVVPNFRWTLEQDDTYHVNPSTLDAKTLAVSFHRSYMKVVQSGDETSMPHVEPGQNYFISVLPRAMGGDQPPFSNGGAPVTPGQSAVTVVVSAMPIPTAQLRVRVYHDTSPLNGQFDADEAPLTGFQVRLDDAGGRYGIAGGIMAKDAFDNPLGTVYKACPAGGTCPIEVATMGNGFLTTDAQGYVTFQNLRPGKYTAKVIPPSDGNWQQTTTIEGQKGQDAWVKANEPTFFTEFGPAGPHVEIGFTHLIPTVTIQPAAGQGVGTVTGRITNLHQSRPPDFTMFSGGAFDFTRAWVALNTGVNGDVVYAAPTDADGNFAISGVPAGDYTLAIWDSALDVIFAEKAVTVAGGQTTNMTDIPVFSWFTRLYHYVFEDSNKNGIWDAGDGPGLREVPINTRWRDGSVYATSATDGSGFLPFEETFPFFAWQIAEVDYGRFRATGVTTVTDDGGNPTNTAWPAAVGIDGRVNPSVLVPQPQTDASKWGSNERPSAGGIARTETGPALLEGFQGFVGLTNVFMWGKAPYDQRTPTSVEDIDVAPFGDFPGPGDTDDGCLINGDGSTTPAGCTHNSVFDTDRFHGGITGIVHYSTTRAENNARWGTPEPWEPGIADVTVQLWDATQTHLLNEVQTDNWDKKVPTGCQGQVFTYLGVATDCYDGMRNWNQIRPAVFDGGYAFYTVLQDAPGTATYNQPLANRQAQAPVPPGDYVVKVVVPDGYKIVKEEDKNVDFGDQYIPQQFYLAGASLGDAGDGPATAQPKPTVYEDSLGAPACVGDLHTVPAELSLFPGVPGAYAGEQMPLCDAKLLTVRDGQNPAANFFLYTEAPIAGHIIGFVLDDASNEFDPNSPQFGEKYAPPFLPVSIRDWTGYEISRTYTDRYGVYNALVPSTYTASTPIPSGMTPSMLTACINAPLLANGTADPYYNKQYSQFCYTLNYMPGTTTYLDTPVLPTGAFAGPGQATLDAELPDQTPVVKSVVNRFALTTPVGAPTVPAGSGPYLFGNSANANDRTITITSAGAAVAVPNPAFDQVAFGNVNNGDAGCVAQNGSVIDTCHKTVNRDYSFGSSTGQVYIGATPLQIQSWTGDEIVAIVPTSTSTGQLKVVRSLSGGKTRPSVAGVTVTLASSTGYTAATAPAIVDASVPAAGNVHNTIQSAVDAAPGGGIVLVKPGTYEELVIMDHPVRLQGAGAGSTVINAVKTPAEKMQAWRNRVVSLVTTTPSYLLDFQNTELAALLPPDQSGELLGPILGGEGAAVTVFARRITQRIGATTYVCPPGVARTSAAAFGLASDLTSKARIDGFGLTGSDQAAGIEVNANACNVEVLNNRIFSNMGDFGSGVRLGHPGAITDLAIDPAHNDYARIANNHVLQNTSLNYDGGGAISIGTGADGYQVKENFIAGNFSFGHGGGITHLGLSNGGTIEHNTIVFNEVYNQDLAKEGGAIYIGGVLPAAGAASSNSGDVVVANNQIQGNAAIGDGGGIAVYYAGTSRVGLFGNMIVNNVAGLAGGGIALQEARNVQIVHTTVANNDSLGVAQLAFISPTESRPQVAGIVARTNGVATIRNSVVWQNRSFSYGPCPTPQDPLHPCSVNLNGTTPTAPTYGLRAALAGAGGPPINYFWDFGGSGSLNVAYSNATSFAGTTNSGNNVTTAAPFTSTYFNGDRKQTIAAPDIATAIPVPATFDEGGNFIRPMFGPLTLNRLDTGALYGDYHVTSNFAGGQTLMGATGVFTNITNAADLPAGVKSDADGDVRPNSGPTRGGDQYASGPPAFVPGIAIANASLAEGNAGISQMPFVVTLSAPTTVAVSVNYATSNGTARDTGCTALTQYQCGDYTTTTGTLTIPAGSTTGTIYVPINGDTMFETNETFTMTLSSPVNGTVSGGGTATGTILNDDVRPTITVANASALENSLLLAFPLTLSNPSSETVTVRYATANSSPVSAIGMNAIQCAINATCDYVSGNNILVTILPGQTTATAVVIIKGDTVVEPNETFRLVLSNAVNGALVAGAGDSAVGTILNDDGVVPVP